MLVYQRVSIVHSARMGRSPQSKRACLRRLCLATPWSGSGAVLGDGLWWVGRSFSGVPDTQMPKGTNFGVENG